MKLKSIYAYVLFFFLHISLTLGKERRRHHTRNSLRRNMKTSMDRKHKNKRTNLNNIQDHQLDTEIDPINHNLPEPDSRLNHELLDIRSIDNHQELEDYFNQLSHTHQDLEVNHIEDPFPKNDITGFYENLDGMKSLTEKLIILDQIMDYKSINETLDLLETPNHTEEDHITQNRQLSETESKWKKKWMSCIKDDTHVNKLRIPGTHDSGTKFITPPMYKFAKTQDLSILEQLEAGIRYFDIRTSCRDEEVRIYHGIFSCYVTLEHISYQIKEFLERPESVNEILIIDYTLEQEHDNLCGRGKLSSWFWGRTTNIPEIYEEAFHPIHDRIFKFESGEFSWIKVSQVRGKIILMQDIEEGYPGTYMKGNPFGGIRSDKNKIKTFHSENINLQDDWDYSNLKGYTVESWMDFNNWYKEHFSNMAPEKYIDAKDLAYNAKRDSIEKLMNSVKEADNVNKLNINYFSLSMIPFSITTNVQRLNSILLEDKYIETMPQSVYVFDFPKESVIHAVVFANSNNFKSLECMGNSKKKLHRRRRNKH